MSAVADAVKNIVQPFLQAGAPMGASARYEPEYEFVEQEVAKLGGLDPNSVQWKAVAAQGATVLTTKSKDLAIACYVTIAWFITDGAPGLASGLEVIAWMLNEQWDGLFPEKKRLRGRIAALQWFATQLERELSQKKLTKNDAALAKVCAERLESIGEKARVLLADEAPNFAISIRALKSASAVSVKESPRPEAGQQTLEQNDAATTASGESAGAAMNGKGGASVSISTPSDVPKALRSIQDMLRQTAGVLLAQKIEDVRAYRYVRVAAWLNIDSAPPHQNGLTGLRPVTGDVLAKCRNYQAQGDHRSLLIEVENALARTPFWLDGHLMSYQALGALGGGGKAARDLVAREVGRFIDRVPGVAELKFSDGTPFASEETRGWLEREAQSTTGVAAAASVPVLMPTATIDTGEADPLKEIRDLIAQGKFKEGMSRLGELQRHTGPGRRRFLLQLTQARMCFEQQRVDLALPQLEALENEFAQRNLDDWEPEIARDVLQLLLLCYEKSGDTRKKIGLRKGDKIQELYARLCRLDLASAMEMNERVTFKKLVDLAYEV
ncbi:MAG: type VI secretion system protein TssA [Pseudomonadota bacterium]